MLGEESSPQLGKMGSVELADEQLLMDQALTSIYNQTDPGKFGGGTGKKVPGGRGVGNGLSALVLSKWLRDVRTLFDKELVIIIQLDTMKRCSPEQLLFEPELLENLELDMNLAPMISALKDQIPERSKDRVQVFAPRIVEEVSRLPADDIRRTVTAAVDRRRYSPIPSAAAPDYKDTIRGNLKSYNPELKRLVPEHSYSYDRTMSSAANKYTVILDVNQNGSTGESVTYSSATSCILTGITLVKTRTVALGAKITNLTEQCEDPMDLLFGSQLGGGTDIERSVAYYWQFMENPGETLFFLVSDPTGGDNRAGPLGRIREMKESGMAVVCLLTTADGGKPYYDERTAGRTTSMDVLCFACNP